MKKFKTQSEESLLEKTNEMELLEKQILLLKLVFLLRSEINIFLKSLKIFLAYNNFFLLTLNVSTNYQTLKNKTIVQNKVFFLSINFLNMYYNRKISSAYNLLVFIKPHVIKKNISQNNTLTVSKTITMLKTLRQCRLL